MTNQPPGDDMRAVWQEQPTEETAMSMNEIRTKIEKFERNIKLRHLVQYIAAVYVVVMFGSGVVTHPDLVVRIGCGLIVAATLFVMYQLGSRASARTLSSDAAFGTCLDFYRSELVRQRDLLRTVWLWYIGPLLPGLIVFGWGIADIRSDRMRGDWWNVVTALLLLLTVMFAWRKARKLQIQIDELDALRTEN